MKMYEINYKGRMVLYAKDEEDAQYRFWEDMPLAEVEIEEILLDEETEDCRRHHGGN